METFFQDLRYGFRMLRKNPGLTLVAVVTLALGIGANTAIFSIVNATLLRPLPFSEPQRLVWVWDVQPNYGNAPSSYPEFLDWRNRNQVFESIAGYQGANFNLTGVGDPERVPGLLTTANFFSLLGVQPVLGRTFLDEEDRPGANPVVLLSQSFWKSHFGADPGLIGRTIVFNGKSHSVVGILPNSSIGRFRGDVFVPLALDPTKMSRGLHFLNVVARLKKGMGLERAQGDMDTVAAQIRKQNATDHGIRLVTLRELIIGNSRLLLLVLLGVVSFVLLIACANVANLQLARANARLKELAIRTALGARRARLVRQWLTESAALAIVGGTLGVALAYWSVHFLRASSLVNFPRLDEAGIDGRVLGFTLGVSLLSSLLFGLIPALQSSTLNLNDSLKEGGRGSSSGMTHHLTRDGLIVIEVALSLVLLIGAGLMIKSFIRLLRVNPGFHPENVITMKINLPASTYGDNQKQASFYQQVLHRLENLPGVVAASVVNNLPMGGGSTNGDFDVEGNPPWPNGQGPITEDHVVGPNYFRVMRIPLMRGRYFTERDVVGAPSVVVINEAFAQRVWPNENPLGKRVRIGWPNNNWLEVIGVVGNVKQEALDSATTLEAYVPFLQGPVPAMTLVVRTNGNPNSWVGAVRSQILAVDKNQPIYNVMSLEEVISISVGQRRWNMILLAVFAGVALILAAVGVYGVISYAVSRRTHEIGTRMALGARQIDVLRMIIAQGVVLSLYGVILGLASSFLLTRFLSGLLFEVTSTDPMTYVLIPVLLAFVALVASYIPARRATKVDPMVALRYE